MGAKLNALVRERKARVLLLDGSAMPGLEYTALRMLVDAEQRLQREGIELWLAALSPEALDLVRRTPLAERLGRERMFFNVEQGAAAYASRMPGGTS